MNYSSIDFARLSKGEDVALRYKDIFILPLFKILKQKLQKLVPPSPLLRTGRSLEKVVNKAKKAVSYLQKKIRSANG